MSYDVDIADKSFNYTSNVRDLFHDHVVDVNGMTGVQCLHGRTGSEAVRILADAFERISSSRRKLYVQGAVGEPKFCETYDAENGWGSAIGGILFLGNILAACALHPDEFVYVSA